MSGKMKEAAGEGVDAPYDPALTPELPGGPTVTIAVPIAPRYPPAGGA